MDVHAFLRKVMADSACLSGEDGSVCGKKVVVLVTFNEDGARVSVPLCQEHWAEARSHPHYFGAEEL